MWENTTLVLNYPVTFVPGSARCSSALCLFHKLCYLSVAHCDGGIFLCVCDFLRLRTIKQVTMHMKCEMDVKLSGLVVDQNLFTDVLLKISNTKLAGFSG